jgi:hypothetical protein
MNRAAASNNGMHPTADTTALIYINLLGRRVMRGVKPLTSRRQELKVLGSSLAKKRGCV